MLVGEASGQMEARDQLPFRHYAPAGSVLERCLRRMGLSRQSFSITNVVRCRPRHDFLENAPWEYAAINHCRPNLDAAIRERRPRCIVALGGTALRELTGVAGEALGVTHLAGYVLPLRGSKSEVFICGMCEGKDPKCDHCFGTGKVTRKVTHDAIPVLADFHPSYLRRGKASHQGVFSRILKRGLDIASGADRGWMWEVDPDDCSTWNAPQGGRLQYWTKPSLEQCQNVLNYLRSNQGLWLAKDLETYESASIDEDAREGFQDTQIRQFQLSYQAGTGIAIPYEGEFKKIIHEFLRLPNQFYGHNWDNFDHKVLRAASTREGWTYAPPVRCFDTLDMFHHWQPDLPAHLQFAASFIKWPFPWKHLAGTDIEFYGICDVDSDLQLGEFLQKMLKADGIWDDRSYYEVVGKGSVLTQGLNTNADLNGAGHSAPPFPTRGYIGQVRELRPVLAAMEDAGMPIDNMRRLRLGEDFQKASDAIAAKLMPLFPESAKKLEPYKTLPPELKKLPEGEWGRLFREDDRWKCKCGRANNRMDTAQCECGREQEDGTVKPGKWYRYGLRKIEEIGGCGDAVQIGAKQAGAASAERLANGGVFPDGKGAEQTQQTEVQCLTHPPLSNEQRPSQSHAGGFTGDSRGIKGEQDGTPLPVNRLSSTAADKSVEYPAWRWCYIPEFNPNSRLMVIAYMKSKGHAVPKSKEEDSEGNQKDTTASKELQRLAAKTGDTFYLDVVEYRGLSKMRGTYVEGFKPSADGCVHTTFTTSTAIGQLASHNPNVQNFPKLKPTPELAKAMREMVAPKPRMVITEWDYKSCHALTLGYLAESHRYMRMARLDIHSFVAGHFLNLWDAREIERESDGELKARFKWLKSDKERKRVRDDQAKHSILGIGNGLRAKGLVERYMEQFPPRTCPECKGIGKVMGVRAVKTCPLCKGSGTQGGLSIALQFEKILRGEKDEDGKRISEGLFDEVFDWQDRVQMLAHDKRMLITEFGHIRRFYEVKSWDSKLNKGKGGWGHGDQAEESIAYWLANIAFSHIREALKELGRQGLADKYGLFNNIHDSFMFHFDQESLEEHKRDILPVLLAPSKILTNSKVAPGGLVIDVEGSWTDRDWAHMKDMFEPEPTKVTYDGNKFTYLGAKNEHLTSSPETSCPRRPLAPAGVPMLPVRDEAPV